MILRSNPSSSNAIIDTHNIGGNSDSDDLPITVIHIILSYLPDAKERAQKALISTTWLFAWNTYPYLIFNQVDMVSRLKLYDPLDVLQEILDTYISRVNGAISKYERLSNNETAKQLRVQVKLFDSKLKDYMDRWIHIALYHRVEDITLVIDYMNERYYEERGNLYYTMPVEVFSNGFIKTLNLLGGPIIRLPFVNVNLSGLRSLSLSVPMDDKMLKKLISGCPLLEKLMIRVPNDIKRVQVPGHSHLKEVEVTRTGQHVSYDVFQHVIIDAPMLETFVCVNFEDQTRCAWKLNLDSCHNFIFLGPQIWKFFYWFPVVCLTYENIKEEYVFNDPQQKLLKPDLDSLKFSVVLHQFNSNDGYASHPTLPHLQLVVQNSSQKCQANIKLCTHKHETCNYWLYRLMLFLNRSRSCKFEVLYVSVFFMGDLPLDSSGRLSRPPCNIKRLNLYVKEIPSQHYLSLLNILFAAVHPGMLYLFPESDVSFLKSLCKQLAKENVFPCWRRYLDDARILSPEGLEEFGPVNKNTLSTLLPSFRKNQRPLCFRLKWRSYAS